MIHNTYESSVRDAFYVISNAKNIFKRGKYIQEGKIYLRGLF